MEYLITVGKRELLHPQLNRGSTLPKVEVQIGPALFTFDGDTLEELDGALSEMAEASGKVFDSVATIQQVALGKGIFSGAPQSVSQQPSTGGGGNTASASSGNTPGKPADCIHGEWKWLEGKNKKTNLPYKGWFCAGRYPNNCPPVKV